MFCPNELFYEISLRISYQKISFRRKLTFRTMTMSKHSRCCFWQEEPAGCLRQEKKVSNTYRNIPDPHGTKWYVQNRYIIYVYDFMNIVFVSKKCWNNILFWAIQSSAWCRPQMQHVTGYKVQGPLTCNPLHKTLAHLCIHEEWSGFQISLHIIRSAPSASFRWEILSPH